MNTNFSRLIGVLALAALAQSARAELKWEQTSVDLRPKFDDKQAIAHFKYENVGNTPVHFKSVHASCGCTTAQTQNEQVGPGQRGEITATFNIGGRTGTPGLGPYQLSKWAVEGFSEVLAKEVGPLGIKVTIVEPGGFATDWGGASAQHATQMQAYDGARAAIAGFRSTNIPGDPDATGPAILKVVDAKDPPLRIFFGSGGLPMTRAEYARRLETWEKWSDVSMEAQGSLAPKG